MKRILLCITFLFIAISSMMARKHAPAEQFSTGDPVLDSIVVRLNRIERNYINQGIGKLNFDAVVMGTSLCTQNNRVSKLISDILPFDWRKEPREFEALIQGSYQHPCNLLITPVSMFSNNRRSRKALQEVRQIIWPLSGMTLMNDKGSNKAYVSPFSDDGLKQYIFFFNGNYDVTDTTKVVIHFSPKRSNHMLINGDVWVDKTTLTINQIAFDGLIDFGSVNDTIIFQEIGAPFIDRSIINLNYRYGRTRGSNRFDCIYHINQFEALDSMELGRKNYDLTDAYRQYSTQYLSMPEATVEDISEVKDSSLLNNPKETVIQSPFRKRLQQLPRQLVGRSYFNAFGSEVRLNGILNPASFGYDKRNGITLRERIRFVKNWEDGKSLLIQPEIGYSFGYHQLRYRFNLNWCFNPSHRASFSISALNKASGFSSKYKEVVDNLLKEKQKTFENDKKNPWKKKMNFDDLELYFLHHHEVRTELSLELANGLMGYVGLFYNYRTPERHGSRSISDEQFNKLIEDHYADLNPFIRFEYTPKQYYYFDKGYKRYLSSLWPTFSLEFAQGLYGWLGSKSNYSRIEFDVQQNIKVGANRAISYHVGAGTFAKQSGEYFINYHYFSRSQYPSTWEEKIGGSFSLLDDYWYNSSPAYYQAHIMFESPFMLLNKIPIISKYVIKERVYLSHLIADGKNSYSEFGYGMGNNYFNIGVFGSMIGMELWETGVKFTFEIDKHL